TRDNYYYSFASSAAGSYGVVPTQSSDSKIMNNIFHHLISASITATNSGTVFGYNHAADTGFPTTFMSNHFPNHGSATYVLAEGNSFNGHFSDNVHGSGVFLTDFRNYFPGTMPGKSTNTQAANANAFRRGNNYVGNVFGTSGFHTVYQTCAPPTSGCSTPV